jgi:predicted Zn-dependent peptidase
MTSFDLAPTVWINVAYATCNTSPPVRIAADLISHHLGGGFHSDVFKRFRRERGAAYLVGTTDYPWLGCTAINCFVSVQKNAVHDALGYLLNRMEAHFAGGITQEQLDALKVRVMRGREMEMDSPGPLASYLAYEALRPEENALSSSAARLRVLEAMTLSDLQYAAKTLLAPEGRSVFVGGRVGPLAQFRIRRRLIRSAASPAV